MKRVRVVISGRVQGVWFRESTRREADTLAVGGWIRNRVDGRVEGVFEGEATPVDRLVAWCRRGPERAEVTDVEVEEDAPTGEFSRFEVRS